MKKKLLFSLFGLFAVAFVAYAAALSDADQLRFMYWTLQDKAVIANNAGYVAPYSAENAATAKAALNADIATLDAASKDAENKIASFPYEAAIKKGQSALNFITVDQYKLNHAEALAGYDEGTLTCLSYDEVEKALDDLAEVTLVGTETVEELLPGLQAKLTSKKEELATALEAAYNQINTVVPALNTITITNKLPLHLTKTVGTINKAADSDFDYLKRLDEAWTLVKGSKTFKTLALAKYSETGINDYLAVYEDMKAADAFLNDADLKINVTYNRTKYEYLWDAKMFVVKSRVSAYTNVITKDNVTSEEIIGKLYYIEQVIENKVNLTDAQIAFIQEVFPADKLELLLTEAKKEYKDADLDAQALSLATTFVNKTYKKLFAIADENAKEANLSTINKAKNTYEGYWNATANTTSLKNRTYTKHTWKGYTLDLGAISADEHKTLGQRLQNDIKSFGTSPAVNYRVRIANLLYYAIIDKEANALVTEYISEYDDQIATVSGNMQKETEAGYNNAVCEAENLGHTNIGYTYKYTPNCAITDAWLWVNEAIVTEPTTEQSTADDKVEIGKAIADAAIAKAATNATINLSSLYAKRAAATWIRLYHEKDITLPASADQVTNAWIEAINESNVLVHYDNIFKRAYTTPVEPTEAQYTEAWGYVAYLYEPLKAMYDAGMAATVLAKVTKVQYYQGDKKSHTAGVNGMTSEGAVPTTWKEITDQLAKFKVEDRSGNEVKDENAVAVIWGPTLWYDEVKQYLPANVLVYQKTEYDPETKTSKIDTDDKPVVVDKCYGNNVTVNITLPYHLVKDVAVDNLTLKRTLDLPKNGYRPFYAPFKVAADKLAEKDIKVYSIGGAYQNKMGDEVEVKFGFVEKEAGDAAFAYKPYLIKYVGEKANENNIALGEMELLASTDENMTPVTVNVAGGKTVFTFSSSNQIITVNEGEYFLPGNLSFTRHHDLTGENVAAKRNPSEMHVVISGESKIKYVLGFSEDAEEATGIETVNVEKVSTEGIYTVNGVKVNSMSKPGLYIVNGKKVIKK